MVGLNHWVNFKMDELKTFESRRFTSVDTWLFDKTFVKQFSGQNTQGGRVNLAFVPICSDGRQKLLDYITNVWCTYIILLSNTGRRKWVTSCFYFKMVPSELSPAYYNFRNPFIDKIVGAHLVWRSDRRMLLCQPCHPWKYLRCRSLWLSVYARHWIQRPRKRKKRLKSSQKTELTKDSAWGWTIHWYSP